VNHLKKINFLLNKKKKIKIGSLILFMVIMLIIVFLGKTLFSNFFDQTLKTEINEKSIILLSQNIQITEDLKKDIDTVENEIFTLQNMQKSLIRKLTNIEKSLEGRSFGGKVIKVFNEIVSTEFVLDTIISQIIINSDNGEIIFYILRDNEIEDELKKPESYEDLNISLDKVGSIDYTDALQLDLYDLNVGDKNEQ